MSGLLKAARGASRQGLFWNILTFDTMITGPVIHLLYWAGLALIGLVAFGVVGSTIGVAIRETSFIGILLAIPILVVGSFIVIGLVIAWRSACEFYVAIFRIAEDLRALRGAMEAQAAAPAAPPAPQPPPSTSYSV